MLYPSRHWSSRPPTRSRPRVATRRWRFLVQPAWIASHLFVAVMVIAMVNLGLWQVRRLEGRRQINAMLAARMAAPPVPIDHLVSPTTPVTTADHQADRRVRATGVFDTPGPGGDRTRDRRRREPRLVAGHPAGAGRRLGRDREPRAHPLRRLARRRPPQPGRRAGRLPGTRRGRSR